MKESSFYKIQAKELVGEKWKTLALAYLVYFGITMAASMIPVVSYVSTFLLAGPFTFALTVMVMKAVSGNDIEIGEIFSGFEKFVDLLVLYLRQMAIIFLWSLLFVIPGIMAGFSYALTYFVYAENPGMSAKEAMDESKRLMEGHRWELFMVELQYIGWILLAPFTLGIISFWLIPQMQAATALFYYDLKAQNPCGIQSNQDFNPDYPQINAQGGYTRNNYTQANPIITPPPAQVPQVTPSPQAPQIAAPTAQDDSNQSQENFHNTLNSIDKNDYEYKE